MLVITRKKNDSILIGDDIEITSGLSGDEKVVTNPGEQLADGTIVQVSEAPTSAPAGQQATTQP